jgi:hypothetical protein
MKASRLLSLPPYLFEELENRYTQAIAKGRDVIDLTVVVSRRVMISFSF